MFLRGVVLSIIIIIASCFDFISQNEHYSLNCSFIQNLDDIIISGDLIVLWGNVDTPPSIKIYNHTLPNTPNFLFDNIDIIHAIGKSTIDITNKRITGINGVEYKLRTYNLHDGSLYSEVDFNYQNWYNPFYDILTGDLYAILEKYPDSDDIVYDIAKIDYWTGSIQLFGLSIDVNVSAGCFIPPARTITSKGEYIFSVECTDELSLTFYIIDLFSQMIFEIKTSGITNIISLHYDFINDILYASHNTENPILSYVFWNNNDITFEKVYVIEGDKKRSIQNQTNFLECTQFDFLLNM